MNALTVVNVVDVKTMTSREISTLTGKNHSDVMRDIRVMLDSLEKDQSKFADIFPDAYGRSQPCFKLPQEESICLVAGYNPKMRMAIIQRWKELEEVVKSHVAALPNFDDPIAAAEAWIVEKKAVLQLSNDLAQKVIQIAQEAPKVIFHDAVMADTRHYDFTAAAKILGMGRNKFIAWLRLGNYLREDNSPYQSATKYLKYQYYEGVTANGFLPKPKTVVTSEGIVWFQKKLDKEAK